MSYVAGYEYDVFISYAHADSRPDQPDQKSWVEQFYNALENHLFQRSTKIKIGIDRNFLNGNKVFDKTIENVISKSATMLCLFSDGFIREDGYCRKELNAFLKKIQNEEIGLAVAKDRIRISKLFLHDIPLKDREEFEDEIIEEFKREIQTQTHSVDKCITSTTGMNFFKKEIDDERGLKFAINDDKTTEQIHRLSNAIFDTLKQFPKQPVASPSGEDKRMEIFVADVIGETLTKNKNALIKKLVENNYSVFTESAYNIQQLPEKVKSAGIAIQLIDDSIINNPDDYIIEQIKKLYEFSRLPLFIIPENEEGQQENIKAEILRHKKSTKVLSERSDILICNTGSIFDEIKKVINEVKSNNYPSHVHTAFVDFDESTKIYGHLITAYLLRKGLDADLIKVEGNPTPDTVIEKLKQNVIGSKGFIILHGDTKLKKRLKERITKIIHFLLDTNGVGKVFVVNTPPQKTDSNDLTFELFNLTCKEYNHSDSEEFEPVDQILDNIINELRPN
ncbi:MAG: toll/interleukin-1 receptor domain-containing protein [Agriterribacter sp.]